MRVIYFLFRDANGTVHNANDTNIYERSKFVLESFIQQFLLHTFLILLHPHNMYPYINTRALTKLSCILIKILVGLTDA